MCLRVDDVITKNERYQVCRRGRHAGLKESPQAVALKEAVRRAAEAAGVTTITAGLWRLEVLTVWPKQRHHDDGSETAYGCSITRSPPTQRVSAGLSRGCHR